MAEKDCSDQDIRNAMHGYWKSHCKETTLNRMLGEKNPEVICQYEIPEILGLLPDYTGKDVVELAAGIGRFTGRLAEKAKNVYASDFIQEYVDKNLEDNCHQRNVSVTCSDVTKMALPEESADLVFTNWLLMYMSDKEVRDLLERQLSWLREGGHLFFRESCFYAGDIKVIKSFEGNPGPVHPTVFRSPADYSTLYQSVSIPDKTGEGSYEYDLVLCRSVQAYIKLKSIPTQICWLLVKVHRAPHKDEKDTEKCENHFLAVKHYSRTEILRDERVFGLNFTTPGGRTITAEYVAMLELKPGETVLEVGSGIGGCAFYMAEKFDVSVLGIDISTNMVDLAWERLNELKAQKVQFEVADITKREFEKEVFDVIYSNCALHYVKDKITLFRKFHKWLKPGGRLMTTDYCCRDGEQTDRFKAYVKQRDYHFPTLKHCSEIIESAGFVNVKVEDKTDKFVECLKQDLAQTKSIKDDFVKEFSQSNYDVTMDTWENTLERCRQGDQICGLLYAEKLS